MPQHGHVGGEPCQQGLQQPNQSERLQLCGDLPGDIAHLHVGDQHQHSQEPHPCGHSSVLAPHDCLPRQRGARVLAAHRRAFGQDEQRAEGLVRRDAAHQPDIEQVQAADRAVHAAAAHGACQYDFKFCERDAGVRGCGWHAFAQGDPAAADQRVRHCALATAARRRI